MASLYKRAHSPFWWIKYRDPQTNRVVRKSTRFKIGIGTYTRKAREYCAQLSLAESAISVAKAAELWNEWVPAYLKDRYVNSLSLARLNPIWNTLMLWLEEKKILSPRVLTREHCLGYLAWRSKPDKSKGKFKASHNTAVMEAKVLSMIMSEAVRRGYAASNPCRDLGLRLTARKVRPELSEDDMDTIRAGIEREPEPLKTFLRSSFEIARYQGCRIAETYLNPMTDVDIEIVPQSDGTQIKKGKIRFHAKGGKIHEAPLHPKLIPFFEDLRVRGLTATYQKQTNPTLWHHFLRRIGLAQRMPNVCFHSLRVTAASRMARSKVPEAKAMKFLGHASVTIHRAYQRLRLEDLDDAVEALS